MSTQYPSEREEVGWMLKDIKEQQSSQPTGAPAPCVWREMEDGEGKWRKTVMRTTCGLREDADEMRPLSQWPFCPQCGHPLTVER